MEKKVWFIIAAVVLFFGGAIWVSEAPIWGPLIACLEVVGGFLCGFFFKKETEKFKLLAAQDQCMSLTQEVDSLKDALKKLKVEKAEKAEKTVKATKKHKE